MYKEYINMGNSLKYLYCRMKALRSIMATTMTVYNFKTDQNTTHEDKIKYLGSTINTYQAYKKTREQRNIIKAIYKEYKGWR